MGLNRMEHFLVITYGQYIGLGLVIFPKNELLGSPQT